MEQKNDKQHLENVWRKQAKFMDNPTKSYGGFQKNNRRQTMYNPQIEMFARFKMKSSFHKTKRII